MHRGAVASRRLEAALHGPHGLIAHVLVELRQSLVVAQVYKQVNLVSVDKHRRQLPLRKCYDKLIFKDATEESSEIMKGDEITEVNDAVDLETMLLELKKPIALRMVVCRMQPGHLGIWVGKSAVAWVKDYSVVDFTDYEDQLRHGGHMVSLAKKQQEQDEYLAKVSDRRQEQAATTLQCAVHLRKEMVKQRMRVYRDAEAAGQAQDLREATALQWVFLLAFFNKIDKVLHEPEIFEPIYHEYLETLDRECPPPPPPPLEKPPRERDEELQHKYEVTKATHTQLAKSTALRVLGPDQYERLRTSEKGVALLQMQKGSIAQKCWEQAMQATTERDHQEYLRKAFCLENDYDSVEDIAPEEFKRWLESKAEEMDLASRKRAAKDSKKPTSSPMAAPMGSPSSTASK
mmetsp:Transcript_48754/g.156669  ORF Transcript_48754/g.156669 Transcript_48754/m.156669 type:complete len:404 (+) Transcript_48754:51-1262(+)